jgi:hypothetical protein
MKIVIVGAGFSGCSAAISARMQGAEAVLVERTDLILGCGLVGGIMRNNGRFTAAEEMLAMGGGEMFRITDSITLHRNVEFPGHHHASLYDARVIEQAVRAALLDHGVELHLGTRVDDVEMRGPAIRAVTGKKGKEMVRFEGDAFIDASGTAGGPPQCTKHGNGCVMCVLRCPSFGGRVSITARCGVKEMAGMTGGRMGAMSGSCELRKESLSDEILSRLDETGVAIIPLPPELRSSGKLATKACQQYTDAAYGDNVIILHTGHAKLMTTHFPLELLRKVPGMERARYQDPYAGGLGNSIRFIGMAPRDDTLKVKGIDNLFCAGEKAGLLVGHTEAIATGTLAGYNAARSAAGGKTAAYPETLAVGDAISYVRKGMETAEGLGVKYTFSGSVYFDRMVKMGLYETDVEKIRQRVDKVGMTGFFARMGRHG